jgi:hypothetical protein
VIPKQLSTTTDSKAAEASGRERRMRHFLS